MRASSDTDVQQHAFALSIDSGREQRLRKADGLAERDGSIQELHLQAGCVQLTDLGTTTAGQSATGLRMLQSVRDFVSGFNKAGALHGCTCTRISATSPRKAARARPGWRAQT
ncbi:hypothetical protein CTTA_3600 [Comamonas testosteroni]|uniref:Uncharacterized protein n=1 Tax=Comamonas testosteroni TaxID=285 RepID=A0A5A7MIR0_COMTE|nr:hypothetical protein CTTA_3600 [Comamonas testosteroni]